MIVYLDTSALVKRYVREPGSDRVTQVCSRAAGNWLVSTELIRAEFASSLARRLREGLLDTYQNRLIWRTFLGDARREYRLAPVDRQVLNLARRLLMGHSLRTLDAVHLATAERLRRLNPESWLFLTADNRQEAVAKAEGWSTELV